MASSSSTIEEKIENNIWENDFDETVALIKKLFTECKSHEGWTWAYSRGFRCKYISLRIDMRDGGFILCDKDGKRIDLEELKYQYKDGN